ncbi:hypothetical protein Patl1_14561 [Pistacia atlantica]|uniref:Uncharacterized protein n=1 Tax=Pistacia atlantica TaxID=434234 RepID=A0ACC1AWI1_9ROSI|nr:hypothetical protein Patl1_14561 [Pistacia atlantica]
MGRIQYISQPSSGHVNVLKELVQVKTQCGWKERSDNFTCLPRFDQPEAMKFLVEAMNDHEFMNSKGDDRNTILQLEWLINKWRGAISAKDIAVSSHELASTQTSILTSHGNDQINVLHPQDIRSISPATAREVSNGGYKRF